MFTGIVETTGAITLSRQSPGGRRLRVDVGAIARELSLGASVCVSGVCLTVAELPENAVEFDVIAETLDRSTLGAKGVGDRVNIERSLRVGDAIDGHFVQGHVDGVGVVDRVTASSREHVVWVRPDESVLPYIIPKGSVAIDGVSLTIAEVRDGAFSVALIPTTLERTTFAALTAGDRVNLESDIIARTVVHQLSRMSVSTGLSLDALRKAGFA